MTQDAEQDTQQMGNATASPAAILDALQTGVITVNGAMRCVYANVAAAALLAQPREALQGRTLGTDAGEGSVEELLARVCHATQKTGQATALEGYITAGGVWLEARATPLADTVMIVCTDSAERNQLKAERKAAPAREDVVTASALASAHELAVAFDAMADGVVVLDANGAMLTMNDAARTLFDRVQGMSDMRLSETERFELLTPRDAANNPLRVGQWPTLRILRGERLTEAAGSEVLARTREGDELALTISGAPLMDAAGTITGAVAIYSDSTARRRLETSVQTSEARFRATFEHAAIGLGHVALDGRWLLVNQTLCDIVGYSREELLKHTFQDMTYADDLTADLALVEELLVGMRSMYTMEKRYIRSDGSLIWINLTVALVRDAHSQPQYFISAIEDIAARKVTEGALRELTATLEQRVVERTAALESANEDLDAFAYTAAHDLQAPLRGVQGFAQALLEDYGAKLDPTARLYAERLQIAAERMSHLIDGLLTYGRLGRTEIELSRVELSAMIAQAQAQITTQLAQTNALVRVDEPLPLVYAHSDGLTQALANLLSNATTYVAKGVTPQIHIWAEKRTRDEHGKAQEWVRLWVTDTGIGIAEENQERIFRPFERLHGMETYPGTGIGLAIVRRSVERMNGRYGVESRVGAGSAFWIELVSAPALADDV